MKKKGTKRTPEKKALTLAIAFVLVIVLYALGCSPCYIGLKTRILHQFYNELQQIEFADLDDDDIENLNEFQKEKFEVMVVNDAFKPVYTTKNAVP